ncbi:ring-cleaving dioxygenase [Chelatococcus reniformis]|uniref:Glyoxalase n=1 Tax=Chelatococcus reniformis TaxID=1494448 RepID=A0A916TWC6_9HYPH|nr:ring-cleaving dioxygenase [Chelatococcus reniformis]GGC46323.1 glyoxalase [Chelatococcus reniformis]
MQLTGLHHVTAVSADAAGNHAFYTGVLGMRLVKRTVNQDDVSGYHLFYADEAASPGSDLTFFEWPVPQEQRGGDSVVRTALRVGSAEALAYWQRRFNELGVTHGVVTVRDGRPTLDFEDPEGQRLALIDDGGAGDAHPWDRSPVPRPYQIRGLGPVTLCVTGLDKLDAVLTKVMDMRMTRSYADPALGEVRVYEMGVGGPAAELHAVERPELERSVQGAGAVHHVAFRTPDPAQYHAWTQRLDALRVPNSGEVDRFYFRSLYFREPNGILFEIATDGPGFATDEPADRLGERLALPPFLEGRRAEIEAGLKPLPTA